MYNITNYGQLHNYLYITIIRNVLKYIGSYKILLGCNGASKPKTLRVPDC